MCWFRTLPLLLLSSPLWAVEGYFVGAGIEADDADSLSGSALVDVGLTKNTWVSALLSANSVDLRPDLTMNTVYADLGIDHWFEPIGIRAGVAYWGDSDVLESIDYRGSLYWRGDKASLSADFERRNFKFEIFRTIALPNQDVEFHSNGAGLSARFDLSEAVTLSLSGIDYDYDVDLQLAANRPIADFLTASRLSLINSLTDYRASAGISWDVGKRSWSFDYATWEGEVDGTRTDSLTLRFLTPLNSRSDVEFGLGVDDNDVFGSVTLFSVFIYFYGVPL